MEQTLTKLYPANPTSTSNLGFGNDIAIDGGWMVVSHLGAQYQEIYMFKWDGSQWIEHQKIGYPGQHETLNAYYGGSVDISGDTIVVAAYHDNGEGTGKTTIDRGGGSVFVYRLDATDNDTWKQEAIIANDLQSPEGGGPNWTNFFGQFLRLEGDTLVVPHFNGGYVLGFVTIYDRDCTSGTCSWSKLQRIEGPDTPGDHSGFGGGVALSGNTLFVGAHGIDVDGVSNAGTIFYYTRDQVGGQWTRQQSFTTSGAMNNDQSSIILAFDGETLLVPSWLRTVDGVPGVGHAWVFEQNSNTGEWEVTQELENPSGAAGIYYGAWRPSVRGDTLVIPSRAGIDVWKKTGGTWALEKTISKSGEHCESTAFHDDSLVFSCDFTDGKKGAIYYLTCPDAFPAAAADGGSAPASGGKCTHFLCAISPYHGSNMP